MKAQLFVLLLLFSAPIYSQCYQQKDSTELGYLGLHFLNDQVGYVAGFQQNVTNYDGIIKKTTDGGNTWQTVYNDTSISTQFLHDVFFIEGTNNNGWAVGNEGQILHTLDAGQTWLPQTPILPNSYHAVHFPNAKYGYIAGANCVVGTKTNGTTWDTLLFIPPPPPLTLDPPQLSLTNVHFVNDSMGAVSGSYTQSAGAIPPEAMILYTYDFGENWSIAYSKPNDIVMDMQFLASPIAYASMSHDLLKSVDNGENWSIVPNPDSLTFGGPIYFRDEMNGYALLYEGVAPNLSLALHYTYNGGMTWTNICNMGLPSWFNSDLYVNKLEEGIASFWGNGVLGSIVKFEENTLVSIPQKNTFTCTVFPNPAQTDLQIELPEKEIEHFAEWKIIDVQGKTCLTGKTTSPSFEVSVQALPNSLYFLQIQTDKGKLATQKVMKN
ncbi:MAG: YCF48-related protein [Bacteroidia bacterium]